MTCSSSNAERCGFAFGLRVVAGPPLEDLAASGTGPTWPVCLHRRPELPTLPRNRRIDEGHDATGRLVHAVDADPEHGFRMWAEGYGTFAISADGASIEYTVESESPWRRYLVGQVLPLAALLHGLEILHASAVTVDGRCIAVAGAPGAGKTSLAVRMAMADAQWMTDDVLALAPTGRSGLMAHSGPVLARVPANDKALTDGRLGPPLGWHDGKASVRMASTARCADLGLLYLLHRDSAVRELAFVAVHDPRMLLSTSFNFAVTDPARLERQLETCARLAGLGAFRIDAPSTLGADELAQAIAAHARTQRH